MVLPVSPPVVLAKLSGTSYGGSMVPFVALFLLLKWHFWNSCGSFASRCGTFMVASETVMTPVHFLK